MAKWTTVSVRGSWTISCSDVTYVWTGIVSRLISCWTNSNWEVLSCWEIWSWVSTCGWTNLVTVSLGSVLMSLVDYEASPSGTDVPEIVGVTGVSILTEIHYSSNSDEELGVLDVLDLVKWHRFAQIGVDSGGKGGLLTVLHERYGMGLFSYMIDD